MGFFDKAKDTVSNAAEKVKDNVSSGVGRASDIAQDPARLSRAVVTGGLSEAWGMSQDPAKRKAAKAEEDMKQAQEEGRATATDYLNQMGRTSDFAHEKQTKRLEDYKSSRASMDKTADAADQTYGNSLQASEQQNKSRIESLMAGAQDQAQRADKVYSNSIQPSFKNAMEQADQNASQAMSLQDAGNMNNPVQAGVRDFFNKQATNAGRVGMQDVGMLQSLGAQANAQQMGAGAPMTGAQMMMMQQSNAAQAGQAFANTQRRMQGLRDQGIAQGLIQSGQQYDRGQQAIDTASRQRQGFMGAEAGDQARQQAARGEQYGFGNAITGSEKAAASAGYNSTMSQYNRGMDRNSQTYNLDTGLANQRLNDEQMRSQMGQNIALGKVSDSMMDAYSKMASANQQINAQNAILGAGMQVGGAVAGAFAGGPAGAQVGSTVGGAVGNATTQNMNANTAPVMAYRPPQGVGYYGGGYG